MDARKLARVHRVRTLQLGLARAQEVAAGQRVATEAALSQRIGELAAAIAPSAEEQRATSFHAAAHYRERLHHSAAAAADRVAAAQQAEERAAEATRAARQDQSAVEKLMARADQQAQLRERRAGENAPSPVPHRFRHEVC